MPVLTRPGVYVDQSAFPTFVAATPGTASAAFVGTCPRGPLTPTVVTSWRDFIRTYGDFTTTWPALPGAAVVPSPLHLAVYSYFSAGGSSAAVVRVTTSTAQPDEATVVLSDRGTTPQPTLQVDAVNPGSWGNNVYIDILDGTFSGGTPIAPQTFTIVVKYLGTSAANVVETWPNLSMTPTGINPGQNNYALDIVNSLFTGSKYITLLRPTTPSTNPPPSNNPAVISNQQLQGGLDGPGSPPAAVPAPTPTDFVNACTLLDQFPDQPFVLNLCGVSDTNTVSNVITNYVQPRTNIFMVLDPPAAYAPTAMEAWALALSFRTPQAAIYYPQLVIDDPYNSQVGVTRIVPPGGFVVGQYISTDASRGVSKAPAGLATSLGGVYGVEPTGVLSNSDQGALNNVNVNCLISVPGFGVVIWGARTLSDYLVTRYVPVSRALIYLSTELVALTRFAVFEPNDFVLWNQISSVLSQFLSSFWQSGGLMGQSATDAFFVTCNSTINTPQSIQSGVVNVEVGVALQYPAEYVVIKIGQWAGGQTVSITP